MTVTLQDIQDAAERIKPYAHRTPVLTNESLDQKVGTQVYLKCENMQKVGAFKFRLLHRSMNRLHCTRPEI